jgi:glycosyltransferase involved in cell wall biosynthesis
MSERRRERPTVSICIPVYNGEAFVREAIASALAQQGVDSIEVLIVDNASTDRTPEIVASFTDARVRYHRNDANLGAVPNFNRAIALAQGEYVKILCADDVIYPTCVAKQLGALRRAGPHTALACCARAVLVGQGRRRARRAYPGRGRQIAGRDAIVACVRRGTNLIGEPGAVLARRDAIEAAGGFAPDQSFCVDIDLWFRLLLTGDLVVVAETLAGFRVRADSWSISLSRHHAESFRELIARYRDHPGVRLSRRDVLQGGAMATVNAWLRAVFYRVMLGTP